MQVLMFPSAPGLMFILAPKHVFVIDILEKNSYALTHGEFVHIVSKVKQ